MGTRRLEAFSDGVLAIIITIMVLELKVPHGSTLAALRPVYPIMISYLLSFTYIGIYWNNHHHLMLSVKHINGKVMWANMHLLFWLSLIPFASGWAGENSFAVWTVVMYGFILAMSAIAYFILARVLIGLHGKNSTLAEAVGKDRKGILSVILYILGIVLAFVQPLFGFGIYVLVAAIWFIPDKRLEKKLVQEEEKETTD